MFSLAQTVSTGEMESHQLRVSPWQLPGDPSQPFFRRCNTVWAEQSRRAWQPYLCMGSGWLGWHSTGMTAATAAGLRPTAADRRQRCLTHGALPTSLPADLLLLLFLQRLGRAAAGHRGLAAGLPELRTNRPGLAQLGPRQLPAAARAHCLSHDPCGIRVGRMGGKVVLGWVQWLKHDGEGSPRHHVEGSPATSHTARCVRGGCRRVHLPSTPGTAR